MSNVRYLGLVEGECGASTYGHDYNGCPLCKITPLHTGSVPNSGTGALVTYSLYRTSRQGKYVAQFHGCKKSCRIHLTRPDQTAKRMVKYTGSLTLAEAVVRDMRVALNRVTVPAPVVTRVVPAPPPAPRKRQREESALDILAAVAVEAKMKLQCR
jgi:hypothetical protein